MHVSPVARERVNVIDPFETWLMNQTHSMRGDAEFDSRHLRFQQDMSVLKRQ